MSKTLPERLRDAARKLRTSNMPLSDFIPLLQQAADALESRAMSKTLPPLPALPPAEVQEWSESWITLRGEGWTRETVEKYASDYALAAIEAQGVPDCKVVDVGFRWDADRQEHVPSIKVEFAPVKANSQNDAKGWKDRDALAAMLAAAPPAPQPQPVQQEQASRTNCGGCANADSWGLPDKAICKSCVGGNHWQPLNKSSVNPNTAQPVQEPVTAIGTVISYLSNDGRTKWTFQPEADAWLIPQDQRALERGARSCFNVYTSPQAAQPLSDQEIADAAPVNETLAHGFKLGVRWAEAAHGIKE